MPGFEPGSSGDRSANCATTTALSVILNCFPSDKKSVLATELAAGILLQEPYLTEAYNDDRPFQVAEKEAVMLQVPEGEDIVLHVPNRFVNQNYLALTHSPIR